MLGKLEDGQQERRQKRAVLRNAEDRIPVRAEGAADSWKIKGKGVLYPEREWEAEVAEVQNAGRAESGKLGWMGWLGRLGQF